MPSVREQLTLGYKSLMIPIHRTRTDDHIVSHLRIRHVPDAQIAATVPAEGSLESVARLDLLISEDLDVFSASVNFVSLKPLARGV